MPHSFRFSCVAAVLALSVVAAPAVTRRAADDERRRPPAKPPHLIRVNRCDPQRQVTTVPAYPGFAPGFYPGNPYYWNDVYGYRYYQPQIVNSSGTLYLDYVNDTPEGDGHDRVRFDRERPLGGRGSGRRNVFTGRRNQAPIRPEPERFSAADRTAAMRAVAHYVQRRNEVEESALARAAARYLRAKRLGPAQRSAA